MLFRFSYLVFIFTILPGILSSRVLELSDKFIDISTEGLWFVKFYAPWCAHCRRLEPVWAHVAQSLYNTPIKVAKVDCTRFTLMPSHFKIRAYPTILFIKGSFQHEYTGDRNKEDMVNYALRMSQPAVQRVSEADNISYIKDMHPLFFGYVGKQKGLLWEMFSLHAEKYQPHAWFYSMSYELIQDELRPPSDSAVFVYKEDEAYFLENEPGMAEDKDYLNNTINKWINIERFGLFPKITRSNIKHLMDTEKYIVLAVVSENKLNEITQTEQDFVDMIQGIIKKRKNDLHNRFQFGWTASVELANSIVMSELRVPNLLVINSTTSHHHLPDDDPMLMTPEAVLMFLDQVHNQLAPTYGGNSLPVRMYRGFYEARSALSNMWHGNPVLTALVFGLPLGFLSLICYSVCCADILDAEDEDNYSETHEKKD